MVRLATVLVNLKARSSALVWAKVSTMKLRFRKSRSLTHQSSDSWIYRLCLYTARRGYRKEEQLLERAIDAEALGKVSSAKRYRRRASRQHKYSEESERVAVERLKLTTRSKSTKSSEQAVMTETAPAVMATQDAITEESDAANWLEILDGLGEF